MSITYTDIFCGAGGSSIGLTEAGLELKLAANHWDRAIATHSANFRDAEHLCFAAGTLVLTSRGNRPIEDVEPGDLVLTHRGRWRPVVRKFRKRDNTVIVKSALHAAGTEVTPNHEFWLRRSVLLSVNPGSYIRTFARPEWVPIGDALIDKTYRDARERHSVALPVTFGNLPWEDPPAELGDDPIAAWWLIGRWLGDGHASERNHSVAISCGLHEAEELRPRVPSTWRQTDTGTALAFYCYSIKLYGWLTERFGKGAAAKDLPGWALAMPEGRRRALLDGYLSADGNERDGAVRADTVSKALAMSIRMLAHSLRLKAGLHSSDRSGTCVIGGRQVTRRAAWTVKWQAAPIRQSTFTDDLHCWALIQSVTPGREAVDVFTMEVAEDHSYVADGLVVKNCADVSNYDMRRLPRTDALWASPICTENSPAGGQKRRPKGQLDLLEEAGHVPKAGMERTRATFHDVIRAAEVHRYKAVIVENVTEAAEWELFDWWLSGMELLGYAHQFVSVSSAHVGGDGNPRAPQWRDRLYIVFTAKGIPLPDVSPRPLAWCWSCQDAVEAFQAWKKPGARKIGKYGRQYVYCCPNTACGHAVAEPFVLPAASAIDWSDLGTPVGDRKRPLAENTMRRIRAGLDMFSQPGSESSVPFLTLLRSGRIRNFPAGGEPLAAIMTEGSNHGLVLPVGGANHDQPGTQTGEPFRTRVTRDTDALVTQPFITMLRGPANAPRGTMDDSLATVTTGRNHGLTVPPFITVLRNNQTAMGTDEPLATVATSGWHHGLSVPPSFLVKNYGGYLTPERNITPSDLPVGTVTANDHHSLVVPFRNRSKATTTGTPLHAMATRDSAALVQPDDADVMACRLRMLKPREHLRAQRFPDTYIVTGNQGEQTMQAGNAVSANVAHFLGKAVAAVLG